MFGKKNPRTLVHWFRRKLLWGGEIVGRTSNVHNLPFSDSGSHSWSICINMFDEQPQITFKPIKQNGEALMCHNCDSDGDGRSPISMNHVL